MVPRVAWGMAAGSHGRLWSKGGTWATDASQSPRRWQPCPAGLIGGLAGDIQELARGRQLPLKRGGLWPGHPSGVLFVSQMQDPGTQVWVPSCLLCALRRTA